VDMDIHGYIHGSDFQPGFRGTLGFRGHLLRVPRLVSKKNTKLPSVWNYVKPCHRSNNHQILGSKLSLL